MAGRLVKKLRIAREPPTRIQRSFPAYRASLRLVEEDSKKSRLGVVTHFDFGCYDVTQFVA